MIPIRKIIFFLFKLYIYIKDSISYIIPTLYVKFIFHLFGCKYGNNLNINGNIFIRIIRPNTISLGNNVKIISNFSSNTVGLTNPTVLECLKKGQIIIGNNTGLSSVIISASELVKIGNNVKIGGNVRIFDHDFHSLDFLNRRNGMLDVKNVKSDKIIIEDDVFIGTNSIILKGVHIGANSIIGAGSVVALKKIPSNSIVCGNPAKIINH